MSVLLETSLGDIVIDLETEKCPRTCNNFLKLCAAYRYNLCAFFSVQKGFLAQTGDPSNSGKGGSSAFNLLPSSSPDYTPAPFFRPERHASLKHTARGTVSMALSRSPDARSNRQDDDDEESEDRVAGSQFFITLADNIEYLDGKHAPFGSVVEGQEPGGTLDKINSAFVDKDMRPLRDIRIKHVVVLDDPFEPLEGLDIPSRTPSPTPEQLASIGLDASEEITDGVDRPPEEIEEERRKADSSAAALTLEMVGDLPFAEVRPPENILFVCKLNPVTRSEDLELIFSRFGTIMSCEVIRDKKTGDSLQYAFIEFDKKEQAEQAYFKMQNVLVDDRRIWVDFSQSVSKLHGSWLSSRGAAPGGNPGRRGGAGGGIGNGGGGGGGGGARAASDLVFDFDDVRQSGRDRRDGRDADKDRPSHHRRDRQEGGRERDFKRGKERDRDRDREYRYGNGDRERERGSERARDYDRRGGYDRHRDDGRRRYDHDDDRRSRRAFDERDSYRDRSPPSRSRR